MLEHDIYYYLKLAREQIKLEQQANRDFMVCQMNGKTIPVTEHNIETRRPYGLVPRL